MKYAAIVETRGARFPSEVERVYSLRAGRNGSGKVLAQHRARGDYRATDAAVQDLTATAERLGYVLAD